MNAPGTPPGQLIPWKPAASNQITPIEEDPADEPAGEPAVAVRQPFEARIEAAEARRRHSERAGTGIERITFYHVNGDNVSFVPRPLKDHPFTQPAILEDDRECLGPQPFEKLSGAPAPDDHLSHDILGWPRSS
jgi:hypothetical protein